MKDLSIMAEVVCQAVLVASVKEVSWPSGKQSSDMTWRPGGLPEENSQK